MRGPPKRSTSLSDILLSVEIKVTTDRVVNPTITHINAQCMDCGMNTDAINDGAQPDQCKKTASASTPMTIEIIRPTSRSACSPYLASP